MKSKKRTRIAILVVVLLSSLSFWLFQKNKNGTLRKELYDFAVEDTASISKIYMVSMAGKQLTLTKNKPGQWTVNGIAFVFQLLAHFRWNFLVAFGHFDDLELPGF